MFFWSSLAFSMIQRMLAYSPLNSPGQNTGVGSLSLLQGILPSQGWNTRSPTLQVDSLPAKPQGKLKNTGEDSLSLLQWIFPTQELNWGFLHCRQILYQLSYPGRLDMTKTLYNCQLIIGWSLRNIECFITWLKPLLIIKTFYVSLRSSNHQLASLWQI